MTTEEMLRLFDEGKISIILGSDDDEIAELSEFFENHGYHPFDLSSISEYIYDCLGRRGWPNICIGDELEIQGCGDTFVQNNVDGFSVTIREFLGNERVAETPSYEFESIF